MRAVRQRLPQIEGLKYIFFDIFDTILLRTVHPEYTKMIWAKRLSVQYANLFSAEEVYQCRHGIEARLCEQNAQQGYDKEFNYEQMVYQLFRWFQSKPVFSNVISYERLYRQCLDIETDAELGVQYVDSEWIEFVKTVKASTNLKIICVSDFYLPAETIKAFFDFHAISEYVDEIVVSSETLLTKRSGRLYDLVVNDRNIDPNSVLMVGDNEVSDYEVPLARNMHAHLIDRQHERAFYDGFLKEHTFSDNRKIENELLRLSEQGRKKSPFHNIIFSLFYFIKQMHQTLVSGGVKNVFFLSREGEYLKELFELYQQREGFRREQRVNAHYLKVSRKATFIPSLKSLETEPFWALFRQYRKISLYDFLASLNFEESVISALGDQFNIDPHLKQEDFPTSPFFVTLKENPMFRDYYERNRVEQNELFRKYVGQFGVDIEREGLHLVDVGWKGTIQDNIRNIYGGDLPITGYYVGIVAAGDMQPGNEKLGLLFSCLPKETPYFGIFNENRAIYEIMLGASHGSAERYFLAPEGKVDVQTKQADKEKEIFERIVAPAQREMMMTFDKLCDLICLRSLSLAGSLRQFAAIHADLMLKPTREELSFFDKLYHYENFGFFQFTEFHSQGEKIRFPQKVKNLLRLIKNPQGFFSGSFWGPITLRDNGLLLLLPLYSRYKKRKYFIETSKENQYKASQDDKIEERIRNLENGIKDRDEAIVNMTRMIDDRDKAIKSMTAMIDERDALIQQLNEMIEKTS